MVMGNITPCKTKILLFSLGLAVGAFLSWALFALIYSPDEAQFLKTAYARYFKELSNADLIQHGSYGDCRLLEPDGKKSEWV